jgi:hypothetical protein
MKCPLLIPPSSAKKTASACPPTAIFSSGIVATLVQSQAKGIARGEAFLLTNV